MNQIQRIQARTSDDNDTPSRRPTIPAPAFTAVRAAALREQVAFDRHIRARSSELNRPLARFHVRLWNTEGWAHERELDARDGGCAVRAVMRALLERGVKIPSDAQFKVRNLSAADTVRPPALALEGGE